MKKRFAFLALGLLVGGIYALCTCGKPKARRVILISIDTCRADYLGCYGKDGGITPNIDSLADDGILFRQAVSPVPLTLPAHSSLLTGTMPASHGLHNNFSCLGTSATTLAEVLKEAGLKTVGIASAVVLEAQFGLAQGFDTYNDRFTNPQGGDLGQERRADETTQVALDWLEKNADSEFFLFMHYFDPHAPYAAPAPYPSRFPGDPYAAEIAYTDSEIGILVDGLKEMDMYDNTLILLVGDHGEMLGERGEPEHGFFIYGPAVNVPLIIKRSGSAKGSTTDTVAGLIDVVPTVCSALDVEPPRGIEGRDLFAAIIDESVDAEIYIESTTPAKYGANPLLGVVTRNWKYISGTTPELYDLTTDPAEENNVAKAEAGIVKEMEQRIVGLLDRAAGAEGQGVDAQLDERTKQQLLSLGYTAGASGELKVDRTKPDASTVLQAHVTLQAAQRLMKQRKLTEARTSIERVLQDMPNLHELHMYLGDIAAASGEFADALGAYNRAASMAPDDHEIYIKRASVHARSGQMKEAVADFDRAVELAPHLPGVLCGRAGFRQQTGDIAAALADYEEALKLNPLYADAYILRANLYQSANDLNAALSDYSEALTLRPSMPELWYSRALVRKQLGDEAGAQEDLRKALDTAPPNWPHRPMVEGLLKK